MLVSSSKQDEKKSLEVFLFNKNKASRASLEFFSGKRKDREKN